MHFKIIIPMYNVEKWVQTTIKSILAQTHGDYEVIIVDDISTDNSCQKVKELIEGDKRFQLVENKIKKFALQNIVEGIKSLSPQDEDIIVTLDGDDWFPNAHVLEKISNTYKNTDCLITYGTYMTYPEGNRPWNVTQYSTEVINDSSYRQDTWRASHLRTFKHYLWKNIDEKDLKDSEGNFYRMAWDLAFMFPMLEMAGQRQQYIQDITYVYNRANPLNDDKVDHSCQLTLEREIRQKKKYELLSAPIEKITIVLKRHEGNSGLGNLMFTLATGVAVSLKNNKGYISTIPNGFNKYSDNILRNIEVTTINPSHIYNEISFTYNEIPNVSAIDGYFQSEKYFVNYKEQIYKLFSPIAKIQEYINNKYGDILNNSVGIHVRRGDYLNYPDIHPACSMEYYNKALKRFKNRENFIVFSDDIKWCKNNFDKNFHFVEYEKDYMDLYIMSQCTDNIIANSSFSWWAAWLNKNPDKKIIAPKLWFGKDKQLSTKDLIPANWLVI